MSRLELSGQRKIRHTGFCGNMTHFVSPVGLAISHTPTSCTSLSLILTFFWWFWHDFHVLLSHNFDLVPLNTEISICSHPKPLSHFTLVFYLPSPILLLQLSANTPSHLVHSPYSPRSCYRAHSSVREPSLAHIYLHPHPTPAICAVVLSSQPLPPIQVSFLPLPSATPCNSTWIPGFSSPLPSPVLFMLFLVFSLIKSSIFAKEQAAGNPFC